MNLGVIKKLLFPNIKETIVRFPFPVMCSALFTFLCAVEINEISIGIKPESWFYLFLLCGFFAYTVLRLFSENHNINTKISILLILGLTIFLIFFCWNPDPVELSLLLSGVVLLLLIAPYIFNDMGETACCNFNTKLVSSIFFSVLAAIILCTGLSLAFISIHYLFDVKIGEKLYANIWLVGSAFFGPFYALSGVPKDFRPKEKEYPKGIAFIFSYILSPLIIGYFAILYAYIIKIVMEWNLPEGNVAYMVLTFGIIGIFTHTFSYPLRDTGTKLLKIVYRYFYYALLAPVVLLLVGIGVRINDYGVTEERYLVVLFAIWFLLSALYFILNKEPKSKNIILTMSIMLILSSFGVWGAVHVSGISQVARLQNLLKQNNILVNGAIHKRSDEMNVEDQKHISSIVDYLSKGYKTALIKDWFTSNSYINSTRDKRLHASKIMDDMGIKYLNKWQVVEEHSNRFYLSNPKVTNPVLLNIKGFDYYTHVGYANLTAPNWSKTLEIPNEINKKLELYIVHEGVLGITYPDKGIALEFDFADVVNRLIRTGVKTGNIPESKRELFILTKEVGEFKVRIYLNSISGDVKGAEPNISTINFGVAVKYADR